MFKREIYRSGKTESEFIVGFCADIAQKSDGRIVCTANGLDEATPMFALTVDGSYQITFVRDGNRNTSAGSYTVRPSRGSVSQPSITIGNPSMFTAEAARTFRYSIICSSRAMLLELGGEMTGMIKQPVISILSTNDGIGGVRAAPEGQITTTSALITKDGTSLYIRDRILQYNPATPKKLQISRNKELYDSYTGGELAATVPGLRDCMTVPSKLHFIAGGKEYYSLDSGFDINHEAAEASTVMEVG